MRVLGIDPGTLQLGYGLIEEVQGRLHVYDFGTLKFRSSLPMEQRLYQIYSHLLNMVSVLNPDEVAIEEPFMGQGDSQYVSPAFAVGQAQAAVLIASASQGIPIFRYSPSQVKSSVADHGSASKEQVQTMVKLILSLSEPPKPFDASDALAIALCHLRQRAITNLIDTST
ncbi:crossover junction endodeoxyribonuclease RuvC [SAR202 cluster bacterium AD-804-J14_MRT_500m]|nr:crossover junction endodeoxyribonuclease RuvC [SAR202 cluster bacterium AD-804-J14_MRT_500m]